MNLRFSHYGHTKWCISEFKIQYSKSKVGEIVRTVPLVYYKRPDSAPGRTRGALGCHPKDLPRRRKRDTWNIHYITREQEEYNFERSLRSGGLGCSTFQIHTRNFLTAKLSHKGRREMHPELKMFLLVNVAVNPEIIPKCRIKRQRRWRPRSNRP